MADSIDYNKWLQRANQDFKLLEIIYTEGIEGLEDSFCYNCHQAAEKLLKAFILKSEKNIPRTHDLMYLLGISKMYDESLLSLTDALAVLNEYSVSARYPSDFDDERTITDAKEAYEYLLFVKNKFETHFMTPS
jgi:HEPN domain-containing protein